MPMRPVEELLREGLSAGQFGEPLEPHGRHAMGFLSFSGGDHSSGTPLTGRVVDLGSGAGLPALVLIEVCPDSTWTLVERRAGRASMLRRAVRRLGFDDRVEVVADDASVVAWSDRRGSADWVTARSFGPPWATAEFAGPLLSVGGSLLVSEPLDGALDARWPADGVAACGLRLREDWTTDAGRYLRFERVAADLDALPRRSARKSPLF